MTGVWTIYIANQENVRNVPQNWGPQRKWKQFETNQKVRQDSPPEFTTTVEYDSAINFNDLIRFDRDGVTQWVGFVEDIEVDWDQNSRYLLLGGRDLTYLLWRKYVENFNNAIKSTGGFFGNVNAVELTKFLLRTPRSDLPEVEDDSLGNFSIYPYNEEGWGIDISKFTNISSGGHVSKYSGSTSGVGSTTIIQETDNIIATDGYNGYTLIFTSGVNVGLSSIITSSVQSGGPTMTLTVSPAFPNAYTTGDKYSIYLPADRGYGDLATSLLRKRDMVWGNSGSPNQASNQGSDGQIDGVTSIVGWNTFGSTPYISTVNQDKTPTNYIMSTINSNATAIFTQNGLTLENASGINSCYLTVIGASDGSWGWWNTSNCYIYIWVESYQAWIEIGNFGGKSAADAIGDITNLNWRTVVFNLSSIIQNVNDLTLARIKFVEYGSLSTFIQYAYLSIGYIGSGSIQSGEWVNIQFNPVECMGVYIESRASIDQFPQNYHITANTPTETFNGYNRVDSDSYIVPNVADDTIKFISWQSNNSSKVAYFYRKGINGSTPPPIEDFDESFAFTISFSLPCTNSSPLGTPPAFVPFCLADEVADYSIIRNDGSDFTALEVLNINNVLSLQPVERSGGILQYNNNPSISTIESNVPYYVRVTKSGSILTYSVYTDPSMGLNTRIYNCIFDTSPYYSTYTYRYQAITYNQSSIYVTVYSDTMDDITFGNFGGAFLNNGFESGDTTGWTVTNSSVVNDGSAHSGTYDLYMGTGGTCTQADSFSPLYYPFTIYSNCTALGFWYKGHDAGNQLSYKLYYSDGTNSGTITVTYHDTDWHYQDCLSTWSINPTKLLSNILVTNLATFLHIDDFTSKIYSNTNTTTWDNYGGLAQISTNNTKQQEGTGCQEIHCTGNGQGWFFEKDISTPVNGIRVDAWVRCPPPLQDTTNHDILVNATSGWNTSGANHWSVYGAYPYIRTANNQDSNHIFVTGNVATLTYSDYCTFDSINNSFSPTKTFLSVTASNSCSMNVSARIQNNIGGTGSIKNINVRGYLWVQHMNNGVGGWVQIGDSGTFVQSSPYPWANLFAPINVSSYLSSMADWLNAKVYFNIYSIQTSGDASKTQFQIGQVKLHWDGIGSDGYVNLLKVHNNSVGVDPISAYIAEVLVAPSEWATDHQNYMRFLIRGQNGFPVATNGEWGSGWTEFRVYNGSQDSPDPWVKIGFYVNVDAVNGYVKLYNITNWDGFTFDSNNFPADGAYLLCELTGLSNNGSGLINRIDYEAEYGSGGNDYGSSGDSTYDTYLNTIEIFISGAETQTFGEIFAGQGPEVDLLPAPVTNNFYPDIIHSWEPQTLSNIKIYCDDNETAHGWEITQIYVYTTDIPKFRVTMSDPPVGFAPTPFPNEIKMNFSQSVTPIPSAYLNVNYNGTTITIKDEFGNVIISGTPSSSFYAGYFSIWAENSASFSGGSETITCDTPHISNTQTFAELNASSGGSGEKTVYNYPSYVNQPFNYILDARNLTFTDGSSLYFAIDDAISGTYYGLQNEVYGYISWDGTSYSVWIIGANNLNVSRKIFIDTSGYVNVQDTDVGLGVYVTAYDNPFGPNYIGTLLDYDNDTYEWRVDINGGIYTPKAGDLIILATSSGGAGSGQGTLSSETVSTYAGGPYIYLSDANIDFSIFSASELFWIGPANIPKNRLSDVLWDIAVLVNDDYVPFEWWISYPSTDPRGICIGDFHMGPRRGIDNSESVSFVTGTNMESVQYQRSSRDTYQRCQVIGSGEGKNQDDTSSYWQSDQDAMDEINGFAEDIVTQKQVSGGRIANRYAKVQLKLDASPKAKNAITCNLGHDTYLSGTYGVGDDVSLTDFLSGLGPTDSQGGIYRIWNTQVTGDENGEAVQLTCQAPYLDIANVWKNVYKQLKSIGATGVMAQDWTGDGTQTDKVSAEKLTDLFSVSAKNDIITRCWYNYCISPMEYTLIIGNGANWNSASGNLSIWGSSNSGISWLWVEANIMEQKI